MKRLRIFVGTLFLAGIFSATGCGNTEESGPSHVDNIGSITQAAVGPTVNAPVPGTTLAGANVSFSWSANGASALDWWLYIGSFAGGANLFNSGNIEDQSITSTFVTGLPTNGSTIYARLWYRADIECCGPWHYVDATYTAAGGGPVAPAITSPTEASTLSGSNQTFTWTANTTTGITQWWLYVGSQLGVGWSFDSGLLSSATTSIEATNIPTNGGTVWVRLWYYVGTYPSAGSWHHVDSQYVAAGAPAPFPSITSHTPGSQLTGSTETFTWAGNGWGNDGIDYWWLYVGTTQGGTEIYNSGWQGGNVGTSETVNGIPTNGLDVWVRLWYIDSSYVGWRYLDVSYQAADPI